MDVEVKHGVENSAHLSTQEILWLLWSPKTTLPCWVTTGSHPVPN